MDFRADFCRAWNKNILLYSTQGLLGGLLGPPGGFLDPYLEDSGGGKGFRQLAIRCKFDDLS